MEKIARMLRDNEMETLDSVLRYLEREKKNQWSLMNYHEKNSPEWNAYYQKCQGLELVASYIGGRREGIMDTIASS